jgi:hypothetical protein
MATSVESAGIDGTTRTATTIVRARGKREERDMIVYA